jgi:hypothetical protein
LSSPSLLLFPSSSSSFSRYSPWWTLSSPKILLHCSMSFYLRLHFLTTFCLGPPQLTQTTSTEVFLHADCILV